MTRDGTPPEEFRRIARRQLETYSNIEVRDVGIEAIRGDRGAFDVRLDTGRVETRRILLCTGMIDELPEIDGFRALWGKSIFICPYCHGWEVQDRRFGVLVHTVEMLEFGFLLRGWTREVTLLTDGRFRVPSEVPARLTSAGVHIDERRIAKLSGGDKGLERVEFTDGDMMPLDVLFTRPPQRQVPVVESLGLGLDSMGYVEVDDMHRETSVPGIYAAGDLITPMQSAVLAAASGMRAAAMLNHALTAELATSGSLP